jgi:hypothetical protein
MGTTRRAHGIGHILSAVFGFGFREKAFDLLSFRGFAACKYVCTENATLKNGSTRRVARFHL